MIKRAQKEFIIVENSVSHLFLFHTNLSIVICVVFLPGILLVSLIPRIQISETVLPVS